MRDLCSDCDRKAQRKIETEERFSFVLYYRYNCRRRRRRVRCVCKRSIDPIDTFIYLGRHVDVSAFLEQYR